MKLCWLFIYLSWRDGQPLPSIDVEVDVDVDVDVGVALCFG